MTWDGKMVVWEGGSVGRVCEVEGVWCVRCEVEGV